MAKVINIMPLLKLKQQDYCKVFRVKRIYFGRCLEELKVVFWAYPLPNLEATHGSGYTLILRWH